MHKSIYSNCMNSTLLYSDLAQTSSNMLKITASSLTWNILLNPDLNLFKLYGLKSIWLKQVNNISKIISTLCDTFFLILIWIQF